MSSTRQGRAEVKGASFYFELAGGGHTLVLLHAGIADGRMWDGQSEAFARHYAVLRYDRRGFGRTPAPGGAFSHGDDLVGLLRHLGLGRVTLVGCSQGGKIAVDVALKHPELVSSLVLVGAGVSGHEYKAGLPELTRELEEADEAGDVGRVNELELKIWVDGARRAPGEVDRGVRELVREMNLVALTSGVQAGDELPSDVNAAGRLGEIRVPTLVVAGELDTPRTLEAAAVLAEGIRGARLEVIKGAAHLPNMERPEEFNRLVLEFLGGSGVGSEV